MNILMLNPRGVYYDEGQDSYKRISIPINFMRLSSAIKRIELNDDGSWQSVGDIGDVDNEGNLIPDVRDHNMFLVDAAARGFGNSDGLGDTLEERDNRKVRTFGLSDEQIVETVEREGFVPDVVFVSAMFTKQWDSFLECIKMARSKWPEAILVGGGVAATQFDKKPRVYGDENHLDEVFLDESKDRDNFQAEPFTFDHGEGLDIIVRGEGEVTTARLVDALEVILGEGELSTADRYNILSEVPNLYFRTDSNKLGLSEEFLLSLAENGKQHPKLWGPEKEDGKKFVYRTHDRIEIASSSDFNNLPFEDLDLPGLHLDEDYGGERFHAGETRGKKPYDLILGRGCSNTCTFCASKAFFGCFRSISDEKTKKILDILVERGFDEICIEEDNILDDPKRALKVFEMINEAGFPNFTAIGGIEFKMLLFNQPADGKQYYLDRHQLGEDGGAKIISEDEYFEIINEARNFTEPGRFAPLVDGKELIKAMAENGCYRIYLAMESANKETLDSVGKSREISSKYSYSEEEIISELADSGIEVTGGMMMGNPEAEGVAELMNNVRYNRRMLEAGLNKALFFSYVLMPDTPLSTISNAEKRFARIRREYGNMAYGLDTTNVDSLKHRWTAEELMTIINWANRILGAKESRSWQASDKSRIISEEDLEREIEIISDPEILYYMTALRVMEEEGALGIKIYHEALSTIRPSETDNLLPEFAFKVNESEHLADAKRDEIIEISKVLTAEFAKREGAEADPFDDKSEYARDELEVAARTPEIHCKK